MLNDCEIEELYSLDLVQTIGVPANRELNNRLNRKTRTGELNRPIHLMVMNSRRANGVPTKNPSPNLDPAESLKRSLLA